jgi:hypothetical protein
MAESNNIDEKTGLMPPPVNVNVVYINSANVALSATELQFHLLLNGTPSIIAIMPFPVAKTFANTILAAIKDYESKFGIKVQELNELVLQMQKTK